MVAVLAVYSLWRRDVVRFARQPARVVGTLGMPVVFWVLIGSGLGDAFHAGPEAPPGYLAFLFPGTLALIVLFTAVFSTISVIEDRQAGFLQGVLVSPAPRAAIVVGKVAAGTTLALVSAGALLAVAPLGGVPVAPERALAAVAVLALLGVGLTALGLALAWVIESAQGFHAVMNLGLLPMWLLSGAVFPASTAAGWIQAIMAANPLAYGLTALRATLGGQSPPDGWAAALGVPALFAAAAVVVATIVVSRRQG